MRSEGPPTPPSASSTSPPQPKAARGVKIVLGAVIGLLALVGLGVWALVRALSS